MFLSITLLIAKTSLANMWYYQTRGKGEGLLDNFVSMPRKNVCAHHKRLSFLTRQPTRWIHTHTADAQNKSKSKRKHNTMVRITTPKQTQFMYTRGIFERVSDCSTVNLRLRRPRAILDLSHPNDGVQCTFGHCPRPHWLYPRTTSCRIPMTVPNM